VEDHAILEYALKARHRVCTNFQPWQGHAIKWYAFNNTDSEAYSNWV